MAGQKIDRVAEIFWRFQLLPTAEYTVQFEDQHYDLEGEETHGLLQAGELSLEVELSLVLNVLGVTLPLFANQLASVAREKDFWAPQDVGKDGQGAVLKGLKGAVNDKDGI